jgi:hypothetical protein
MCRKVFYPVFFLALLLQGAALASFYHSPTVVPFWQAGQTIFVEATIDGISGNYVLDTGSPELILNNAYFTGRPRAWEKSNVVDMHGQASAALYYPVTQMLLDNMPFDNLLALVMDLSGIEEIKDTSVAGIIGYSVFKDLELVFDFTNRQLLLFPLNKSGIHICLPCSPPPTDSFDIKISGHFPFVIARLGDRELKLGIDSGSEVNILNERVFKKVTTTFEPTGRMYLAGLSDGRKEAPVGMASGISIEDWDFDPVRVVVTDLKHLNRNLPQNLDGILGAPFLSQMKMSINFKRKKLFLWQSPFDQLADKGKTKDTSDTMNKAKK